MNLRNNIKNTIYFLLNYFFSFLPAGRATILMYHSVGDNRVFFTVDVKEFTKQIDYLHKNKYNVISLGRLADILINKENLPPKTVILTFDDGYKDNFDNVFPVLKKYNYPATIFLATGFMGSKIPNSTGTPLDALTWKQVKDMHNSGLVNFEPHTVKHLRLNRVSSTVAETEILSSKRDLEDNLNKECSIFAYPYGAHNPDIKEILARNGFRGAVSVREGTVSRNADRFLLKRNSIDSSVSFSQFKGKLGLSVDIFNFIRRK